MTAATLAGRAVHTPTPALDGTPGVCQCGLPLSARSNACHNIAAAQEAAAASAAADRARTGERDDD